jgi:hypothetical protein
MSIVVIGASLQIAELMKHQDAGFKEDASSTSQQNPSKNKRRENTEVASAAEVSASKLPGTQPSDKTGPQQNLAAKAATSVTQLQKSQDTGQSQISDGRQNSQLQAEMEKLQERNRKLQASLNQASAALRVAEQQAATAGNAKSKSIVDAKSEFQVDELGVDGKAETVIARTATPAQSGQGATAINVRQNGLLVRFTEGALELSASEAKDVITKVNGFGLSGATRWRITVVAPKGFSEALRLAYYRANAVRNALVANGVPGASIDLRVVESTSSSADNTLVSLRPQL